MKQLDKKAVWLFFISYVLRFFFFFIILNMFFLPFLQVFFNSLNFFYFIIPLYLVVCFIWAKLSYHFYRYELNDNGFHKESGVLYKRYITIPYDRIQNVDIYRGIFARIFNLSDLQIQTAGYSVANGMVAEGRLPGLSKEIAEQLRDEVIQKAHKAKNLGL